MKNFKNLKVWQQGIEIVQHVYQLSEKLPSKEKYGLISQMTRAAVSIPSNIAEGSSRKSQKELHYYLEIALGSAFELETLLIVVEKLGLAKGEKLSLLKDLVAEEQMMLNGLMKKI